MAMLMNGEIVLMPLLDALEIQERKQKKKRKTLQQRRHQWKKNEEKHLLNQKYSNTLPAFTSDKPYEVIFINYMSAFFVLLRLIERARKTTFFSVDTETDDSSKEPALIQVEFVQSEDDDKESKPTIVIFEMCQLPSKASPIYPRVQQLLDIIFHPSKTVLIWGDGKIELSKFTIYPLFQAIPVTSLHFINVQNQFKKWYNSTYKHNQKCYMASLNDSADDPHCICAHRPYKNPGDKWSLQRAVAIIFEQFLDKSITRNDWGQGLDIRLYQNLQSGVMNYNVRSILTDKQERIRSQLVQYAIDDCLAATKLAFTIGDYLFQDELSI